MSDAYNDIDLFDSYLRHELSPAEATSFEKRLETDSAFREAFELHSLMAEGIREAGREQLRRFLKENTPPAGGSIIPIRKWLYAAAAVMVIGGCLYLVNMRFKLEKTGTPAGKDMAISQEAQPQADKPVSAQIPEENTEKRSLSEYEEPPAATEADTQTNLVFKNISPDRRSDEYRDKELVMDDQAKQYSAGNAITSSDYDDHIVVLEDEKLMDTTVIPLTVISTNKMAAAPSAYDMVGRKKQKTILPYNNQAQNNIENTNTTGISDSFNFAADKQEVSKENKTDKKTKTYIQNGYTIEFWKSPVNFKGYSFTDKTIQLFGLKTHKVKLLNYEGKLYLKAEDDYYLMTPTDIHIPYKPVTEDAITRQLSTY